ncbi:MAG TPA: hypothetical protein VEQ10_07530, partial [Vicinamibacteria bacterium]|nr:hypothetical protein [Vicinamibacteria bacterium]
MRRCLEPSRSIPPAFALAGAFLLAASAATAQPMARDELPPALRPWVSWVLDEVPSLGCANVQGQVVCVWAGRLSLDLRGDGGGFALELEASRAADLRLPGSADHWPSEVSLDGSPAPVFGRDGAPCLRVPAGRHRASGRFAWSRLPESLGVPAEIGLVDLRLDGQAVARPRRDAAGLVWLRAGGERAGEGESLRLQVFRRIRDGIPLFVETRIELEVSGRAREVALQGALLPSTVPVAVAGDLPARVEDGSLRVQVRGGRYAVSVDARVDGRPRAIALPSSRVEPWPPREVWVFAADERQRQVELSGPVPVDPSRTQLPERWRALPAFLVEPGGSLALAETRRGEAEPPPDSLTLARELWLDRDGQGASVRDRFSGVLRATSRLDLMAPGTLGRVAVDGQDQLVTAQPGTRASGIELRRSALRMEADSRVGVGGAMPAVGWTTGVEQLQATLHVPPGWRLLAAPGVDQVPGTWTARWTLLGFFFVLVLTLAVHRLFGLPAAVAALLALVLTHGEAGAPFAAWLNLVAAIALGRVAPARWMRQLARGWFYLGVAALVVTLVPFTRDQVREALYPQTERTVEEWQGAGGVVGGVPAAPPRRATNAPVPEQAAPESEAEVEAKDELLTKQAAETRRDKSGLLRGVPLSSPAAGHAAMNVALEQDPKAVLQTGPGVPTWSWRSYTLGWSGPVNRDHRIRLILLSPWESRALTLLRLALVGLLGFVLVVGRWPSLPRLPRRATMAPLLAAATSAALLPAPASAQETTPDAALLEQLKARLTRPAACEPHCVTTPSLVLRVGDDRLDLAAEVHAAADGTWALPGPVASWTPAEVRLDGAPAVAIARLVAGFLYLRLPRGVHHVEVAGPVPPGDSFTLQFADPPRRARAEAPGWELSGLRLDGPAEPSILLTRRLGGRAASPEGRYAPWLEVTRTLGFGVTWTV